MNIIIFVFLSFYLEVVVDGVGVFVSENIFIIIRVL